MRAFVIGLSNRPGTLAAALEAIAAAGINVAGVGAATWGDSGAAVLATDNTAGTASALDAAGASYREADVAVASLDHKPGTLARATRALADAGINIEGIFPLGMDGDKVQVGFVVADAAAAQAALG